MMVNKSDTGPCFKWESGNGNRQDHGVRGLVALVSYMACEMVGCPNGMKGREKRWEKGEGGICLCLAWERSFERSRKTTVA